MKNNSAEKVHLASLEDLLGGSSVPKASVAREQGAAEGKVVRLPLKILHTFHSHPHGHPFRVMDDVRMAETVESVLKNGVLEPGIVRPDKVYPGEYELISGHRRRRASELAELSDMPVIIKDLSDQEATVIMTDANLQREDILPSELAWAYRMKYEALKKMGAEEGTRSDAVLAKEAGISRATIQRYIRLTYLLPELLQMVDDGKLSKNPAADLSYLSVEEQESLLALMAELKVVPDGNQSEKLHQFSKDGKISVSVMKYVLEKQPDAAKVSLPSKQIRRYFPESYTGEQIQEIIFTLLQEWQQRQANTV